ncbi:hypothetical protein SAMN05421678_12927 [Actinopolymorpha cephalotaxi]|uniref:Uncharacterized protein n=1 Tax=Actinopolymorpha cephalotaxi TaxID=504797 RepID=A0A1I3C4W3_9ACTN|nr:hypothetical protein [Actinopolymorpha cephalotaxi]NYH85416.1 hypothetical protein [Actinopolymorpha cephalotaxi]SFH69625.1 hypothetical protein SAMN05421678_12927 [Actinopolymorpha cephalotaxi]
MAQQLPTGDLITVLRTLLGSVSPDLFGGTPPAVDIRTATESLTFLTRPRHHEAGPHRQSRTEVLPLDADDPAGPYELEGTAGTGPRTVRLLSNEAVVTVLHPDEVMWDGGSQAGRSFTLSPRRYRTFDVVTHLQVSYGATGVATTMGGRDEVTLELSGLQAPLARARDLLIAVLSLENDRIVSCASVTTVEGDYQTTMGAKALNLKDMSDAPAANGVRTLHVTVTMDVDIDVRRTLRPDEGTPIARIASPGSEGAGAVSVDPLVDA